MHRCLVTTSELLAEAFTLGRDEARHLKTVLRVQPGERVILFDGQGRTRLSAVASVTKHDVSFTAAAPACEHPRPACRITLFACISKGTRMDWTIEKATELGVSRIMPILSERTIVRLDAEEGRARTLRWLRVAEEAARQCGTAWVPEITCPLPLVASLSHVTSAAPVFVAALTPLAKPLREALAAHTTPPAQAGWFVGPEGDFTPSELTALVEAGTRPVSLGQRVLRSETACLYGLCALNCAWL